MTEINNIKEIKDQNKDEDENINKNQELNIVKNDFKKIYELKIEHEYKIDNIIEEIRKLEEKINKINEYYNNEIDKILLKNIKK